MTMTNTITAMRSSTQKAAYELADILATNKQLIADINDLVDANEKNKVSAMIILQDLQEAIPAEKLNAMPLVGSKPKAGQTNANAIYDEYPYYVDGKTKTGHYYDDLADRLVPDIAKANRGIKDYYESKGATKATDMPKGWQWPEFGSTDLDHAKALWSNRQTAIRGLVKKAMRLRQLLTRFEQEGGNLSATIDNPDSTKPILVRYAVIEDGKIKESKQDIWSVGTFLALDRPVLDATGEDTGITKFDQVVNNGATWDALMKTVQRESGKKNKTVAQQLSAIKVTNPNDVIAALHVIETYFYDDKGNVNPQRETAMVEFLKKKDEVEALKSFHTFFGVYDSVTSKTDNVYREVSEAA